jgi:DNA topoisomerase-3
MNKTIVLAEKPSDAREIARILGCKNGGTGFIAGERYIVTWALGHLVTLADPEEYTEAWKEWKMESLPMIPEHHKLVVLKEVSKQFGIVRDLLHREDIDSMVIATDAGREGELVARWIIEKANFRKGLKRLWINSLTDQAIREGFSHLRPASEFNNLFESARARSIADWLVGLNVTRALTCKYNASLSAGRVQTPTLAMIVAREKEIKQFVPKDYFQLTAKAKGVTFTYYDRFNQTRMSDRVQAERILDEARKMPLIVKDITRTLKKEQPLLLYDLTELQRDANRFYGFSAKRTLNLMQQLYENYKYLTYPRTDSKYLSDDIYQTIPDRIRNGVFGVYSKIGMELLKKPLKNNKHIFDTSKVTDHHAIIPTGEKVDISQLDADALKIYELVLKKFLAAFSDDFEYEETTVTANAGGHVFKTRGKTVKKMGFYEVFKAYQEETDDSDQLLPEFKNGETLLKEITLKTGKTTPPARYTEATLLSAMEHPGKFIEDQAKKEIIEQASGIGTPATRADIIERIFDAGYVELKGKDIFPTSKGIQLISLVPENLKTPELTAKWEQQLMLISSGKRQSTSFIKDMEEYTKFLVKEIAASTDNYRHDNLSRSKCPNCGKNLLEINNSKGHMLVCQDRNCNYRKFLSRVSHARCPNCHHFLEIIASSDEDYYLCKCGFREKMSTFNEKLHEAHKDMTKRDISKYIARQKEEIPENLAFAEKFKELNDDNKNKR